MTVVSRQQYGADSLSTLNFLQASLGKGYSAFYFTNPRVLIHLTKSNTVLFCIFLYTAYGCGNSLKSLQRAFPTS
jgi:hypothetical protein